MQETPRISHRHSVGAAAAAAAREYLRSSQFGSCRKENTYECCGTAVRRQCPLCLFHVNFPESDLAELRRRIKATRWPARETATQDVQVCRVESRPADYVLDPAREPPIGSHIVTPRRGYAHHGIYVGKRRVVQYGGLSLGLHRGPVEEVSLSQFTQGREIRVRFDGYSDFHREEVIYRARLRLGENRYHPLKNNCEHFCEWCVRGKPRSYQVEELTARCSRAWPVLLKWLYRTLFELGWLAIKRQQLSQWRRGVVTYKRSHGRVSHCNGYAARGVDGCQPIAWWPESNSSRSLQ
jgi:Lecithin retinol acyltransferase